MAHTREEQLEAFSRLLDVMNELREKCPWDRKQTFRSLRSNTIEETFELADAIQREDMMNIKKELGDVLLHIVFYSKMADERGEFDIADVCNAYATSSYIVIHTSTAMSRQRPPRPSRKIGNS